MRGVFAERHQNYEAFTGDQNFLLFVYTLLINVNTHFVLRFKRYSLSILSFYIIILKSKQVCASIGG